LLLCPTGALPTPCPFDINAYNIALRKPAGQFQGIFSFSAGQLQGDGMIIFKDITVPPALGLGNGLILKISELHHVFELLHLPKSLKLIFPHNALLYIYPIKEKVETYSTLHHFFHNRCGHAYVRGAPAKTLCGQEPAGSRPKSRAAVSLCL